MGQIDLDDNILKGSIPFPLQKTHFISFIIIPPVFQQKPEITTD
jgi:hypothetical protein